MSLDYQPSTQRTVSSESRPHAKIAIVGEAPGATELQQGKPFVGRAGSLLWQCASAAQITREMCSVHNVLDVKPKNILEFYDGKRGLFKAAAEPHLARLKEELEQTDANVLVACGAPALTALTGLRGITKLRGSILDESYPGAVLRVPGRKVIPIIHPSHALRPAAAGKFGGYLYRWAIIRDLKRVRAESEFRENHVPRRDLLLGGNCGEYLAFMDDVYKQKKPFACDIEVMNQEMSCVCVTTNRQDTIVIPFTTMQNSNYFSQSEEKALMLGLARILQDPDIPKIFHNCLFDVDFFAARYGIITQGDIHDTMIMQHVTYYDMPKGLDFCVSAYCKNIPYYKQERKTWKAVKDIRQLWEYNAKDGYGTWEVFENLGQESKDRGTWDTYLFCMKLVRPLLFMQRRGTNVNKKRMQGIKAELEQDMIRLQRELNEAAGETLNANSPKQLATYFYVKKGIKPYLNRKTKKMTTDNMAMKRLARKGHKEASIVRGIRKRSKLLGTYLDIALDRDSRLRAAWNIAGVGSDSADLGGGKGTTTGRLSSSRTIFGTGTNLQNIPRPNNPEFPDLPNIRSFLTADYGCLLFEFDLRQAEWVVVAHLANDGNMIRVFQSGQDTHKYTASLMLDKPYEEITKSERQEKGKTPNHALNYDFGYRSMALKYEMEERVARGIVDKYHTIYPGIRGTFHERVRKQLWHDRTLTTCFGRRRLFLDRMGDSLYKSAYAFTPQSTVGEVINRGFVKAYNDNTIRLLEILMQVHDSLVCQMPINMDFMERALYVFKMMRHLSIELNYNGRQFTIPVDVKVGFNWGNMIELPQWPSTESVVIPVLAKQLQSTVQELVYRAERNDTWAT